MNKKFKKTITGILSVVTLFSALTAYVSAENEPAMQSVEYSGREIVPNITLFSASGQLVEGRDFDVSYDKNINVGVAEAKITFKGNYSGERTVTFNIVPRELSRDLVSFTDIEDQTYTGRAITPEPTIKYGDTILVKGTDYELSYENNENVGTGTVTVTFKGNYSGTANTTFEITPKSITDNDDIVIEAIPDQTYTGEELTPVPVITDRSI